jgi:oligoendopeptidase F
MSFSPRGVVIRNYKDEDTGSLLTRDQIAAKYKWNLTDIYTTEEKWEEDFKWVESKIPKFKEYMGSLGESAENLLSCLKFEDSVTQKLERLFLYAMLSKDVDLSSSKYQGMFSRITDLASKVSAAASFIRPEIIGIPDEKLRNFLLENEELKLYEHQLNDLLRTKAHTLSKEQEEIMALAAPVTQTPGNAFSLFENVDIQFPKVKNEEGKEIQISHGRYYAAMRSKDRSYRQRFYKGLYKPFFDYKNTITALFEGNIKSKIFNAKARKYNSTREAALDVNNIPLSVYDNLIQTVNDNLTPLQRWCTIKKEVLGYDELHPYDTYVSLFDSVQADYEYEDAIELLYEALKPLGEDYISKLKMAFDNRWIDVFETQNKRSGAYSSGTTYGVHPYVLLNWNYQLNDVFTLAHEMGHNLHSYYTGEHQPYPYADYPIFLAEVASTTNEALLLDYLIDKSESKEEKLYLIEKYLTNIQTTFYRQTRFAEFEQNVHQVAEAGEPLTNDNLSKMFGEMYGKYWGNDMVVDEEEYQSWARIPHFYYNFYVYQYATGFAASEMLASNIKNDGKTAVDKYLEFLKSGNSDYAINILNRTGVDMTKPEPVMAVINKMNSLLDELESLIK